MSTMDNLIKELEQTRKELARVREESDLEAIRKLMPEAEIKKER